MRNTKPKKQRRKVKVLWRDAISHAEWCYPSEVKKYKPAINTTEGYLLIRNSEVTIVYMSYNDTDIGDICVIPTENVKTITFVR
jgi:hypothetical protein